MEQSTYSVKEAADILGYSTNSIYSFLKSGKIKGVRVGRGKYHIPKEELDRLLQARNPSLSSNPNPPNPSGVVQATPISIPPQGQTPTDPTIVHHASEEKYHRMPSLFERFLALSSIFLGLSMFLFTGYLEEYAIKLFSPWLLPLKITFIAAGIGLLLINVMGKGRSAWYWIFYTLINICYVVFVLMFFYAHDNEAILIFSLLIATSLLNIIFNFRGAVGFIVYLVGLIYALPLVILFHPSIIKFSSSLFITSWSNWLKVGVSLVASTVVFLLLGLGYHKKKIIHWIGITILLAADIMLSLIYAKELCWSRSLFILMVGFTSLFIPIWGSLKLSEKRDRGIFYKILGVILIIFLWIVGDVLLLQNTLQNYANRELINKLKYGRIMVETTLNHGQLLLENAAQNSLLIEAIEKKDQETLINLMKGMFSGSRNFKRILALDVKGNILGYYPSGLLNKTNLSFREHFIQAATTKRTFVSDLLETVFETPDSQPKDRFVVIIATPIVGKNKEIIGVLDAAVDLEAVGSKLQQLATPTNNEYFTVADRQGRRIIDIDQNLVNTPIDGNDAIYEEAAENVKLTESYNDEGKKVFQVYATIPTNGWIITLSQPFVSIFRNGEGAYLILLCVAIASGLVTVGFLSMVNRKKMGL